MVKSSQMMIEDELQPWLNLSEHIATIDSLRRRYRKRIATTYSAKTGRPKIDDKIEELICKFAKANPSWGEDSIRDRLKLLGIEISGRTISNVLKRNGVPPASERAKTGTWANFLKDHWPGLYAIDFATFEIPDGKRTRRCYAMKLSASEVKLLGVRMHADGKWTTLIARNECNSGFFIDAKHIIMDRDSLSCNSFKEVLKTSELMLFYYRPSHQI